MVSAMVETVNESPGAWIRSSRPKPVRYGLDPRSWESSAASVKPTKPYRGRTGAFLYIGGQRRKEKKRRAP